MTVHRNDPCPCGSGRKYKKCCMRSGGPPGPAGSAPTALDAAKAHHAARRLDDAARGYEAILEREGDVFEALLGLGQIRLHAGEFAGAAALFERAVRAEPKQTDGYRNLAAERQQSGRVDEAIALLEEAMALDPADARSMYLAAICHQQMSRLEEAIELAERALGLDPGNADFETALARMERRAGALEQARTRLNSLTLRLPPSDPDRTSRAWTELGFVRQALGDHDAAFDAFRRAGEAQAATPEARAYDRTSLGPWMEASRAVFTAERLAALPVEEDEGPRLVFLVGFPRSGTTMLEQVLAAHPDVETTDEQPFLQEERKRLAGGTPVGLETVVDGLGPGERAAARTAYRQAVAAWNPAAADGRVLVDKLPLNIVEVGWINLLFPTARILLALRDPRDVCLSCFMQRFGLNAAMVNFLFWERTAAFYGEVMSFWRDMEPRLTVDVLPVRYEETVTDLEGQARRLLDFIGVEWVDDVLRFHEHAREREISTPSFTAVREQVHTRAIGRWHKYARHYEPIMEHLAPYIEAFGYEDGE
jgi:tetratricopeptide (TPR) repeat protein